jgi:hypothetical protein
MPVWIIIAVLGTIGLTALLSSVLWRLNAPRPEPQKRSDGGEAYAPVAGDGRDGRDGNDGTSDASDGGGGDGGGGGE